MNPDTLAQPSAPHPNAPQQANGSASETAGQHIATNGTGQVGMGQAPDGKVDHPQQFIAVQDAVPLPPVV